MQKQILSKALKTHDNKIKAQNLLKPKSNLDLKKKTISREYSIDLFDDISFKNEIEDLTSIEKCKTIKYLSSNNSLTSFPKSFDNLNYYASSLK